MNRIEADSGGNVLVIAIVKGDERYVVVYETESRGDAVRQLGRWALDDSLRFGWKDFDAGIKGMRNLS